MLLCWLLDQDVGCRGREWRWGIFVEQIGFFSAGPHNFAQATSCRHHLTANVSPACLKLVTIWDNQKVWKKSQEDERHSKVLHALFHDPPSNFVCFDVMKLCKNSDGSSNSFDGRLGVAIVKARETRASGPPPKTHGLQTLLPCILHLRSLQLEYSRCGQNQWYKNFPWPGFGVSGFCSNFPLMERLEITGLMVS